MANEITFIPNIDFSRWEKQAKHLAEVQQKSLEVDLHKAAQAYESDMLQAAHSTGLMTEKQIERGIHAVDYDGLEKSFHSAVHDGMKKGLNESKSDIKALSKRLGRDFKKAAKVGLGAGIAGVGGMAALTAAGAGKYDETAERIKAEIEDQREWSNTQRLYKTSDKDTAIMKTVLQSNGMEADDLQGLIEAFSDAQGDHSGKDGTTDNALEKYQGDALSNMMNFLANTDQTMSTEQRNTLWGEMGLGGDRKVAALLASLMSKGSTSMEDIGRNAGITDFAALEKQNQLLNGASAAMQRGKVKIAEQHVTTGLVPAVDYITTTDLKDDEIFRENVTNIDTLAGSKGDEQIVKKVTGEVIIETTNAVKDAVRSFQGGNYKEAASDLGVGAMAVFDSMAEGINELVGTSKATQYNTEQTKEKLEDIKTQKLLDN